MSSNSSAACVVSVSRSARHAFGKEVQLWITLREGFGVEGDAHAGETTQHLYMKRKDPTRANLTQVHLMPAELFEELATQGFNIAAGQMGENVTTLGVDLLALPVGAKLHLGEDAIVEVTGLRDPCNQLNDLAAGLMKALIQKEPDGRIIRKAGIMGTVLRGGVVKAGDAITVELPPLPWQEMGPV